jgi:hypothetical protein
MDIRCAQNILQVFSESFMKAKCMSKTEMPPPMGIFSFQNTHLSLLFSSWYPMGIMGKKWIIQLANLFYDFKMPTSCFFWVISSEYHEEKTNRNFWPFFMLDNAPLQRHYSTQSAPISSQPCSFFRVNLK